MLIVAERSAPHRRQKPADLLRREQCRHPWLWDGLCFAVPFHEASNLGLYDVVNNIRPSTVSGLVWARDAEGNTVARLGTSSYLEYPDNPTHDRPSMELTAYIRTKFAGSSDSDGGLISNWNSLTGPLFMSWQIRQYHNLPNNHLVAEIGIIDTVTTVATSTTDTSSLPQTKFANLVMRWRSGEKVSIMCLGERGEQLFDPDLSPRTADGPLPYAAGNGIRINATQDAAANYSADYSQAMVWSRRLSDTEVYLLCSDPFGWYSPRRETVGISLPVFGGNRNSDASVDMSVSI